MRVVPITLKQANEMISQLHRHHKPVVGHRFSLAAINDLGALVGCCVVGRPVARMVNQYTVAEVTRLATDGSPNACSFLYGAAARVCREMGFESIQTYTLPEEGGASLRASGWVCEGPTGGGDWNRGGSATHKNRRTDQPMQQKIRWRKTLNPSVRSPGDPTRPAAS